MTVAKSTAKNNPSRSTRSSWGKDEWYPLSVWPELRGHARASIAVVCTALFFWLLPGADARAENFDDSQPLWLLLLGGHNPQSLDAPHSLPGSNPSDTISQKPEAQSVPTSAVHAAQQVNPSGLAPTQSDAELGVRKPVLAGCHNSSILVEPLGALTPDYCTAPFQSITLKNIPPLYRAPELPGEGVWRSQGLPAGPGGHPVMYRTSYRPSVEYPNAIVHMLLFDMKRISMKLYIGSTEPGGSSNTATIEPESKSLLLAVTNALWKQKHSGEAGAIFRGRVLKPLCPGMATLVVYNDDSADIVEWNEGIPTSLIRDARQLRHLIVKDGKVVDTVVKGGRASDSEIGLGFLLSEEQSPEQYYWWGGYGGGSPNVNYGADWFIATRSAFGIRKDGNLVFAAGHHISTKDLAKALVLAGCERAIHGDANPHNVLGNLYYPSSDGSMTKKAKLSPEQRDTLNRYDRSYTSDFFAFFLKRDERNSSL